MKKSVFSLFIFSALLLGFNIQAAKTDIDEARISAAQKAFSALANDQDALRAYLAGDLVLDEQFLGNYIDFGGLVKDLGDTIKKEVTGRFDPNGKAGKTVAAVTKIAALIAMLKSDVNQTLPLTLEIIKLIRLYEDELAFAANAAAPGSDAGSAIKNALPKIESMLNRAQCLVK
jgi:hypothetical protein